ncbi:MAG: FHA domain-containing protein [Magnetococcales bacterium]|nr:FHA domain-containing protein [Magnetococcales bacterium]
MVSFQDIIDETGKCDYQALKRFAKEQDQESFVSLVSPRVLVGSGLYRGWFLNDENPDNGSKNKETVLFQPLDRQQKATRLKMLENQIYPLVPRLKPDQGTHENKVRVLTVGRSKKCDIILTDPSISSEHAEFRLDFGDRPSEIACFVRDLGSSNGVFVNGSRFAPFWTKDLAVGDEIRLSRFSVILSNSADIYPKLKYG